MNVKKLKIDLKKGNIIMYRCLFELPVIVWIFNPQFKNFKTTKFDSFSFGFIEFLIAT